MSLVNTSSAGRAGASTHRLAAVLAGAASLIALSAGGCTLNEETGLIGVTDGGCPDLRGAPIAVADGAGATSASSAPLTGLDRRGWPLITVEAPAGQVEHQPTYFEPVTLASGTARGAGLAPTPETVLEGPSDGGSLLAEAAAAPFVFVGELLVAPVRMVFEPPWTMRRSPAASMPAAAPSSEATQWRWVEPAP